MDALPARRRRVNIAEPECGEFPEFPDGFRPGIRKRGQRLRDLAASSRLSTEERPLQLRALHRRKLHVFEERDDLLGEFVLRRRKLRESSASAQAALYVLVDARTGDAPEFRDAATKTPRSGEHRLELVIGKSHGGRLPL
jgi:hypothetical protein